MSAHAEKNPSHDKPPGMAAGTTTIAQLADEITYRGYPLAELAESCSFEEVAYLLLRGDLPGPKEKARFIHRLNASRHLPEALGDLLSSLPAWTPPIDALRTSVSVLAHFDQDATDSSPEAKLRMAERLLAQIPAAIALRARAVQGLQPVEPKEGLGHAAQFLYQLRGKDPAPEETRAMEMALIVFAEHEFNPSTYTSRVVAPPAATSTPRWWQPFAPSRANAMAGPTRRSSVWWKGWPRPAPGANPWRVTLCPRAPLLVLAIPCIPREIHDRPCWNPMSGPCSRPRDWRNGTPSRGRCATC